MATRRRLPGEGTIHRRPNGTWCAQLNLGTDADGNRRRRTVYGRTREDVKDKLDVLRRQLGDHGDLPTSDITVAKWLREWLDGIARERVKPGTLTSYRTAVERYLIPSLGKRPLSRLSPAHVRSMHDYVRSLGCNSTSARKAHRILSAALNDAVKEGRVVRNVAPLVKAPAKAVANRGVLSWAEAKKVLTEAAKDERTAGRWLAAFLLGARQGELLGLRWSHVDMDAGTVDLAWSLQRVAYDHGCGTGPTCGKSKRGCPSKMLPIPDGFEYERLDGNLCLLRPKTDTSKRVMPVPDFLWAALKLRAQQSAAEPNPHNLVWTRPDGRPIHPRDDWQTWHDLLEAAKIGRSVTLHEARHSMVTWLADENVDSELIRDLAGHSDILTQRSYRHASSSTGRRALNLIAQRLELA